MILFGIALLDSGQPFSSLVLGTYTLPFVPGKLKPALDDLTRTLMGSCLSSDGKATNWQLIQQHSVDW